MARRSCLGAGVKYWGNNLLGSRTLSAEHRDLRFTAAVSASKLVQADALKKISVEISRAPKRVPRIWATKKQT